MDVLWEQEKALTASEIIKAKEDSSLYNTSVQVYAESHFILTPCTPTKSLYFFALADFTLLHPE